MTTIVSYISPQQKAHRLSQQQILNSYIENPFVDISTNDVETLKIDLIDCPHSTLCSYHYHLYCFFQYVDNKESQSDYYNFYVSKFGTELISSPGFPRTESEDKINNLMVLNLKNHVSISQILKPSLPIKFDDLPIKFDDFMLWAVARSIGLVEWPSDKDQGHLGFVISAVLDGKFGSNSNVLIALIQSLEKFNLVELYLSFPRSKNQIF